MQTFTVRDQIGQIGYPALFEALASYGYEEVELFGGFDAAEVKQLLDDNFGAASEARGIRWYQHNHDGEFAFAEDDPSMRLYDVLLAETDPDLVYLEMDVYWAYVGQFKYSSRRDADAATPYHACTLGMALLPLVEPLDRTGGTTFSRWDGGRSHDSSGLDCMAMGGRIRDEDIAAVRERARIEAIVGEYVSLRRAGGGSQKGLCPFHDEKTPSFHVNPARNTWHCFGACGEGGDVISFVRKYDQLTFPEAIERLADKVGIQLRYEDSGPAGASGPNRNRELRSKLIDAHRIAAQFYAEQLAESSEAVTGRQFLDSRGFDKDAAAQFGVGYAPRGGEVLRRHLRQSGFSDEDLIASGLVAQGRSAPYDRFRGRLLWPIKDLFGDIVGFGARRLYDDDRIEAKYLNTPETTIYKKSHLLYGVDMAKKEIARRQQAVVVEGYTDVMACHLAGVPHAVATCGTAFGEDHARVLRRLLRDQDELRGEVIFTFDGDEAGRRAAMRAFEGDQQFVGQTRVAIEPNGLDPCDLRLQDGDAAVRELVARHQPLFAFAVRTLIGEYDLDTAEGRTAALDKAIPLVGRIRDRSLRDEYARKLAGWVGASDETTVVRRVRAASGAPGRQRRSSEPPAEGQQALGVPVHGDVDPQTLSLERAALRVAVQRPALAGPSFDGLEPEAFLSPAHRTLRETIAKAGGCATQAGGAEWVSALADAASDDVTRTLISELSAEPMPSGDSSIERYAESVILRLHEVWVSRQVVTLKAKLQRTDPAAETAAYNRLFGELMAMEKHRRDLRERGLGGV